VEPAALVTLEGRLEAQDFGLEEPYAAATPEAPEVASEKLITTDAAAIKTPAEAYKEFLSAATPEQPAEASKLLAAPETLEVPEEVSEVSVSSSTPETSEVSVTALTQEAKASEMSFAVVTSEVSGVPTTAAATPAVPAEASEEPMSSSEAPAQASEMHVATAMTGGMPAEATAGSTPQHQEYGHEAVLTTAGSTPQPQESGLEAAGLSRAVGPTPRSTLVWSQRLMKSVSDHKQGSVFLKDDLDRLQQHLQAVAVAPDEEVEALMEWDGMLPTGNAAAGAKQRLRHGNEEVEGGAFSRQRVVSGTSMQLTAIIHQLEAFKLKLNSRIAEVERFGVELISHQDHARDANSNVIDMTLLNVRNMG
jgi:hypothetical protein